MFDGAWRRSAAVLLALLAVSSTAAAKRKDTPSASPEEARPAAPAPKATQCNPYFPVPPGARWVFALTQGPEKLERIVSVRSSEQAGDVTTVQLEQSMGRPGAPTTPTAGKATTTVRCDGGDISLTVVGTAQGSGPNGPPAGTIRARTQGLPAADKLVVGFSWRSESEIESTVEGGPIRSRAVRGSKVEAIEPVTVPAGEFPHALRVASVENVSLPGDENRKVRQEIVEWYVRGLGLVKREGKVATGQGSVRTIEELVQYSGLIPEK